MNTNCKDNSQASASSSLDLLIQQWIDQHCTLEKCTLALFVPFKILGCFHIDPQSRPGKTMMFIFCIIIFLGLPLALTAVLGQWALAPIETWTVIAIIFGLILGLGYNVYYAIGLNVCSIAHAVIDKDAVQRQITWDKFWFNLRISGTVGAITFVLAVLGEAYISTLLQQIFN